MNKSISFEDKCTASIYSELAGKGKKYFPYTCSVLDKVITLPHEDTDDRYEHFIVFKMKGGKYFPKRRKIIVNTCCRQSTSGSLASIVTETVANLMEKNVLSLLSDGNEIFVDYEKGNSKFTLLKKE